MTVLQFGATPSDTIAANALGFLATLPYQGSEPERARAWVVANISRAATLTIGGAKLTLSGNPRARVLQISSLASE
jgi:hypothetical protein